MQALKELFTSDIGLLSVFTVGFATAMIIFLYNFFKKHMNEDAGKSSR